MINVYSSVFVFAIQHIFRLFVFFILRLCFVALVVLSLLPPACRYELSSQALVFRHSKMY